MSSAIGTKRLVDASAIQVGDFLTRDGFRRACDVKPQLVKMGRGRKRTIRAIAAVITYVDGDTRTIPYEEIDSNGQRVYTTIYRQDDND